MAKDGDHLWDGDSLRPVPGFLRPIDTQRISQDLKLKQQGADRGAHNLPAVETQTFDAVEQSIIETLESEWNWHGGAFLNHLRAYASRLTLFSIDSEFAKLQIGAKNALRQLQAANHRAEADLGPLREHYLASERELRTFRERHGLIRPAREPAHRWVSFGLLFVLVAFESVLNGVFFAKGSQFGLIGGVGTAIGISVVNVIVAFLLGLWPSRWINHTNFPVKLLGAVVAVSGLLALLALHCFAAHLREATPLVGEEGAMRQALQTFRTSPLALNDLNSFYLFGLGSLFAVLAMWKGYSFDDPYPGYGSAFRRFANARADYSDEHAELFDELERIRDQTLTNLRDGITRLPTFPQTAANIRAQRLTMIEQFRAYESSVQAAASRLLAIYRDENITARTEPAPAHFTHGWRLPRSFNNGQEASALMAEGELDQTDINVALATLQRLADEIMEAFGNLLGAYPHPTQMKQNSDV